MLNESLDLDLAATENYCNIKLIVVLYLRNHPTGDEISN
jgi:hypothetical protein